MNLPLNQSLATFGESSIARGMANLYCLRDIVEFIADGSQMIEGNNVHSTR